MKRTSKLMFAFIWIALIGATMNAQAVTFSGTVTDPNGFSLVRIAGATIMVMPGGYNAVTDANGEFSIANVPVGTYTVTVDGAGYTPYTMDLTLALDKHVVFSLTGDPNEQPPIPSFSGTVRGETENGLVPVPNAQVKITPGNIVTYTDQNGNFTLPANLAPGTYTIHVKADSYKPINPRVDLPLTQPLDLILEPIKKIR